MTFYKVAIWIHDRQQVRRAGSQRGALALGQIRRDFQNPVMRRQLPARLQRQQDIQRQPAGAGAKFQHIAASGRQHGGHGIGQALLHFLQGYSPGCCSTLHWPQSTLLRPAFLARYRALSATRISSSQACCLKMALAASMAATPMLMVT